MNEKEAKEIIDNMSEQELNDFIFFALQEVEKENQKLKTELEKKNKQIEQYQNMLATNDMLHVLECEKKDKIIDLMAEEISKNILNTCPLADYNVDLDCENKCQDNYKECWKQYFEKKVEG